MDKLLEYNLESLKLGLLTSRRYWNRPLLVFNSASFCGYTKQLKSMQTIFENAGLDREDTPTNLPSIDTTPPTEQQLEENNGYNYVDEMDDEPEDVDGLANAEENLQQDMYQIFNE